MTGALWQNFGEGSGLGDIGLSVPGRIKAVTWVAEAHSPTAPGPCRAEVDSWVDLRMFWKSVSTGLFARSHPACGPIPPRSCGAAVFIVPGAETSLRPQPRGALSSLSSLRLSGGLIWLLSGHVQCGILLGEPAERQVGTFWAVHILCFKLWKESQTLSLCRVWTDCGMLPKSSCPSGHSFPHLIAVRFPVRPSPHGQVLPNLLWLSQRSSTLNPQSWLSPLPVFPVPANGYTIPSRRTSQKPGRRPSPLTPRILSVTKTCYSCQTHRSAAQHHHLCPR